MADVHTLGCPAKLEQGADVCNFSYPGKLGVPESLGTTTIVVTFDGGVVLGADSRTSMGDYVSSRATRKINAIHGRIFNLTAGSAADSQALNAIVSTHADELSVKLGQPCTVKQVANVFRNICYENKHILKSSCLVAGWDAEEGGCVYGVLMGGTIINEKWATSGSGSVYIHAFMAENFRENMSEDETVNLVRRALTHAMTHDGASGGIARLVVVTEDQVKEASVVGGVEPPQ